MNIETLRVSKNMTQEQLAEQLGIARSTVAMWESGEAMPRSDKLPELAKILNCSIDELFGENEAIKNGEG